ncbi:hypothetical protein FQR65_LT03508 [Abscondita terminalis]|nr:hypothetical protein FQR65_LT03508 [Abscondita terminalis]
MIENARTKCRICLFEVAEDQKFYDLNDLLLKSKLLGFLPELDLTITENPVACGKCCVEIDKIHEFRHLCLQNEIILKNQNLLETSSNNILSLVEDECLLVNTDIPLWVEESTPNTVFYYCSQCHYATNDKQNLTDHIFDHRFKCSQCTYTTLDDVAFTSHKEIHSNIGPWQCNICNYTCTEMDMLDEHMCTHAEQKLSTEVELKDVVIKDLFECRDSGYQTNTETDFNQRLVTHKNVVKSRMLQRKRNATGKTKRPKLRYSRKNVNNHLNRMHSETENRKPITETIKPKFKTKHKLKQKRFRFKCERCNYGSDVRGNFLNHKNTIHAEPSGPSIKCDTCDYSNYYLYMIKKHMQKYSGQTPLKCDKCDFKTHVLVHFNGHVKKHEPGWTLESSLKCTQCEYVATSTGRLNTHFKIHIREKPFACKWCSYRCSYSCTMAKHKNKCHFSCEQNEAQQDRDSPNMNERSDKCNYTTSIRGRTQTHLRTHAEEKPFACKLCNFKTSYRSNIKKHTTKLHSNPTKELFSCKDCSYRTYVKLHFTGHLRIHTGEKPFACKLCDYKTTFKCNLRTHEKKQRCLPQT